MTRWAVVRVPSGRVLGTVETEHWSEAAQLACLMYGGPLHLDTRASALERAVGADLAADNWEYYRTRILRGAD